MKHSARIQSWLLALSISGAVLCGTGCQDTKSTTSSALDASTAQPQSSTIETSTPRTASSIQVKTDWSYYTPDTQLEEIYTRMSDQPIGDFQPSSEYGGIYPFVGSVTLHAPNDCFLKYGLFDAQGRIVCDAVFDNIYPVSNGYMLQKYTDADSTNPTIKAGFVSKDGSCYTGIIYDGAYYDATQRQICFFTSNATGITTFLFDCDTYETINSYDFQITDGRYGDLVDTFTEFSGIWFDRYLVFDGMVTTLICNGTTGEWLEMPGGGNEESSEDFIKAGECLGCLQYVQNGDEYIAHHSLLDQNFTPIFDQYFLQIEALANGKIFLRTEDRYIITDANGISLVQVPISDEDIHEIEIGANYIIDYMDEEIRVYNDQLDIIETYAIEPDSWSSVSLLCPHNFIQDYAFEYDDILWKSFPEQNELINLHTGASTTLPFGTTGVSLLPDRILVNVGDWDCPTWTLLDSADFHVIAQGKGHAEPFIDEASNTCYLLVYATSEQIGVGKIVDIDSGHTITDIPAIQMKIYHSTTMVVYNQRMVQISYNPYEFVNVPCVTRMFDEEGNLLFQYTPFIWYDD